MPNHFAVQLLDLLKLLVNLFASGVLVSTRGRKKNSKYGMKSWKSGELSRNNGIFFEKKKKCDFFLNYLFLSEATAKNQ